MTETQALTNIGAGVFQAISLSWRKAWDDIRGPFNHPDHDSRVRSSLLQMHAVIHAKELLPPLGVQYMRDQTQHMFVLPDEAACLVYKKLDEDRRAHRNDTARSNQLFQSTLFEDIPTLVCGMVPSFNWLSFTGIYLCRPNLNGVGNAWTLDITDGAVAIDADQSKMISLIEDVESEQDIETKPKPKWKPKYGPNIGESSEEAGSGGNGGA